MTASPPVSTADAVGLPAPEAQIAAELADPAPAAMGPSAALQHSSRTIRAQLMRVVLVTTTIALVVAGSALLIYDLSVYRHSWTIDLSTQADILALASAPALAFDDHKTALRYLDALRSRPTVMAAALYSADGHQFASFNRPGEESPPLAVPPVRDRASGSIYEYATPVLDNGDIIGTLYLRGRYDVAGRVQAYASILAFVGVLSMGVALLLSTWLQRVITTPLESLARVALQIVRQRDYSLRVAPSTSGDEVGVVIAAVNRMLTDVQRTEEALREADRRKDEFLAILAHELRNPLAPIRHAVQLLASPASDDVQRRMAQDVIARQSRHMALLLDDLLDVSRITRGQLRLKQSPVGLESIVHLAVEAAQPLIESKKHTLIVTLPATALTLNADRLRLAQVISNLLTNAAKYTDEGGQISLRATVDEGVLALSVRDNGIGIQPDDLPNLFGMFSQVRTALDRTEGGLGIGLALARGLVELHGGRIEAHSAGPGRGSEFVVRLPCIQHTAESAAVSTDTQNSTQAVAAVKRKLLVADDNRDGADSLAMLLRLEGFEVFTAYDGSEALELGARERPDAMLLDVGMPGLSGYETARRARAEEWGREVILVAVTGWGQQSDKQQAREAGFDHHLTKPVDPDTVGQVLTSLFRKHLGVNPETEA